MLSLCLKCGMSVCTGTDAQLVPILSTTNYKQNLKALLRRRETNNLDLPSACFVVGVRWVGYWVLGTEHWLSFLRATRVTASVTCPSTVNSQWLPATDPSFYIYIDSTFSITATHALHITDYDPDDGR